MPERSWLSGWAVARVAAALLLLAGAGGFGLTWHAVDDERSTAFRRQAAGAGATFQAVTRVLQRGLTAIEALAATQAAPERSAHIKGLVAPDGFAAIAATGVSDAVAPRVLAGTLPAGVTAGDLRGAAGPALDLARDRGQPVAGPLRRGVVVFVIPHYGPGPPPQTTALRRVGLTGWLLVAISPQLVVGRALPAETGLRTRLRIGGDLADARTGAAFDDAVQWSETVAGQPWQLDVSAADTPGPPLPAVTALVLGVLGAVGALAAGARGERRLAAAVTAGRTLARDTRTIAELGPILQQSLDLAEVLPAVTVRLTQEFELERLAVQLVGERGALVDVFSVGGRPLRPPVVLTQTDVGVQVGVDVALPMLRAGRTIGRLRLAARVALGPAQVDALRAAADLIAAATYNVELYAREQATVRRLQELDTLKDAFLGTISHELRTPITAIGGFVRLLAERGDELTAEQRQEFLARLQRNSTSLRLLVDDLLDFARLERQALRVATAPLAIGETVSAIVEQLVPLLGDHEVVTHVDPDLWAMADTGALERVVANLLTNAAKFSPADSRIKVVVQRDDQWICVVVADQGSGIAEADRLRIFSRFYRGDSDAARTTRGAGIGLAVVRELVEQMHGEIDVTSATPHGTRMIVRLPAVACPETTPTPRDPTMGSAAPKHTWSTQ